MRALRRLARSTSRTAGLAAVAGAVLVWSAADGLAHGPAPAIIGLAGGAERPDLVRLSVGLAERVDDGWRWVCPAVWGTPDAPPVAPLGDGALVVADDVVGTLRAGAAFTPSELDLRGDDLLRALEHYAGSALALWWTDDGSRVVRIGVGDAGGVGPTQLSSTEVGATTERWQTVTVDPAGTTIAARTTPDSLIVDAVDGSARWSFELAGGATPELRTAGDALFVTLDGERSDLVELRGERADVRLSSPARIHGPVRLGSGVDSASWVATDGGLWRLIESPTRLGDARRWTCLQATDSGRAYACTQLALYELLESGPAEQPYFALHDVGPPDMTRVPESARIACEAEWADFASDAGLEPGRWDWDAADAEVGARRSGCAVGSSTRRVGWMGVVLVWLGCRRRGSLPIHIHSDRVLDHLSSSAA